MSLDVRYYYVPINPEPWAIGPVGAGRRGGKITPYVGRNQQLHAFKEAVKAELEGATQLPPGQYSLAFYFWRNIAEWETSSGRKAKRNVADVTNLQKATEDALQGVLFDNDRNVKHIESTLVDEGPDVYGQIMIVASNHVPTSYQSRFPDAPWHEIRDSNEADGWAPMEEDLF